MTCLSLSSISSSLFPHLSIQLAQQAARQRDQGADGGRDALADVGLGKGKGGRGEGLLVSPLESIQTVNALFPSLSRPLLRRPSTAAACRPRPSARRRRRPGGKGGGKEDGRLALLQKETKQPSLSLSRTTSYFLLAQALQSQLGVFLQGAIGGTRWAKRPLIQSTIVPLVSLSSLSPPAPRRRRP